MPELIHISKILPDVLKAIKKQKDKVTENNKEG